MHHATGGTGLPAQAYQHRVARFLKRFTRQRTEAIVIDGTVFVVVAATEVVI